MQPAGVNLSIIIFYKPKHFPAKLYMQYLQAYLKIYNISLLQTACYRRFLCMLIPYMLMAENALAQEFRMYQSSRGAEIVIGQNDTIENPWAGGMLNPQFSNINLDGDMRPDLFVFEPADGKISLFMSLSNGSFRYMPQYESAFPKLTNWALLADYNNDGKEDIFTFSTRGAGLDVYKNVSSGNTLAFEKVAERLRYEDIEYSLNIYVPSTDIPALVDIDNDGDLDILSYDVLQYHIQYYKNMSMEKYGVPDSLDFRIADRCWGKFAESFTANTVVLGEHCGNVGKRGKKHGGSTLLAFDYDGDGDKDMLLGDIGYRNLIFLENGKIKNGSRFTLSDSMITVDTVFPRNSRKAELINFPAAFSVDINADGKKDLLVTPQGLFESESASQVLAYINTGTASVPRFEFIQEDFLQNTTFEGGVRSAPAFFDYNNDGLTDLAVAVKANPEADYKFSKLLLYKNIGTAAKPVYSKVNNDLANLSTLRQAALTPAFKDINGDGKPDLILGAESGEVLFYYNQGTDANGMPVFVKANLASIDVGQYSKPTLADIDKDGLQDLVVGELSGNFNYYRNTGSATAPVFTLVSETFGNVVTNVFYYEYEYDDLGEIKDSTLAKEPNGASAPEIADIDNDGKLDMITGSLYGRLIIYFNIEDSLTDTFTGNTYFIYDQLTGKNRQAALGLVSVPALADIDGDGKPELMAGNYRGGLYYFASNPVVLGISDGKKRPKLSQVNVYPNPATQNAYIQLPENTFGKLYSFNITNMLGQKIYIASEKNTNGFINLNVSGYTAGLYIVSLHDDKGNHFSARLYIGN